MFIQLSASDLDCFGSMIGPGNVLTGEDVAVYNVDWMRKYFGKSQLVLRPNTTEQVANVLAYCNQKKCVS